MTKQQSSKKHSANLLVMTEANPNAKKGKPTPARKQQEAARKRPLVAPRTKEAIQAERAARKARRIEASEGLLNGDERFLTRRDAGPQRSLLRDVVDSRYFTMGEILMVFMVATLFFTYSGNAASAISVFLSNAVLILFAMFVADSLLLARAGKKALTRKFGATKLQGGIWFYVAVRSMYPRFMRTPRAKVKRGHKVG